MALVEFYGDGCPHCKNMAPLVEQLQREEGVIVEQYEVWNNEENAKKMADCDKGLCGGVPFFCNTETRAFICGGVSYEDLKAWATRK
ncbi:MAG: thioredoxin family protein [Candidatus Sungbacteria bacterium]|uniref:Thioredoxin family protein n=1 Tax=Candidatus Sungiibacteriota bacterium TaxID=2750080 RepID=A0A931WN83_9BACT|nr:thioredoxin family protein [Candidatus Sungbacteria bacterium]